MARVREDPGYQAGTIWRSNPRRRVYDYGIKNQKQGLRPGPLPLHFPLCHRPVCAYWKAPVKTTWAPLDVTMKPEYCEPELGNVAVAGEITSAVNDIPVVEPAVTVQAAGALPDQVAPPKVIDNESTEVVAVPKLLKISCWLVAGLVHVNVTLEDAALVTVAAVIDALVAVT